MLLVAPDPWFAAHDTGRGHPERAARLEAVSRGLDAAGLRDARVELEPRAATPRALARVHDPTYLASMERFCAEGGGMVDPDTVAGVDSWTAAVHAAGAGLQAVDALRHGLGDAAFLAVRPPGHHAGRSRAMGFCLVNSVAVTAASLTAAGDRVAIIDWDAHHGNGTQDLFWNDPDVLYLSLHESPLFPHTGRLEETGGSAAPGTICNFPLPAGATGDVYLESFDEVIEPIVERFSPDWVVVSAGFDAHRRDPLTGGALSSGDFAALAARVATLTPGRTVAYLEGGYDEQALVDSVAVTSAALLPGAPAPPHEPATSGGPGRDVVRAARRVHFTDGGQSAPVDHER